MKVKYLEVDDDVNVLLNYQIIARRKELFTPNETHELLKLHEKLDTLTKALHNLNLKAEVFVVDLDEHKTQVEEIESEILEILANINLIYVLN